jgi:peptide/nickel transport system substrate-binding protein
MTDMVQRLTTAELNRRNFLKFTGMLSAATAITAGLAACGGGDSSSSGSSDGDSGSAVGTPDNPQGTITGTLGYLLSGGFDPMNASAAPALTANAHIFEGLLDLDPITREPYLALAKEMPTASSDGLTWTATLRDGATFSDGTPVTADDVAWSFNRVLDPANGAITAGFISSFMQQVTATDASTVQFALKAPFALFTQRIAVVKIVPKAPTGDATASKAFDSAPIGSGPFKLDSASTTTGLVMSNNTGYNGPRPALVTKIVLNTTPDNAARLNDLQGGQSQAIEAVPYLDAGSVSDPYEMQEKDSFNSLFLMFNCSAPPFDDKRVRQALHYAIDTKKVITTALQGYGTAATSYLDEGNAGYQKAATVYDYDPEKAKSLLKEAGVSDLSFELVTTNISFISDSAPVIIDSWKAIGVNATLNTNPAAAVYGTIVPADTFRVLAASGDPTIYGPDVDLVLRWFYYGQTWPKARERWTDEAAARCSELIDQAATQEGDEQKATWKKVLDLVSDEVPLYPVYHTKAITAWDPEQLTDFRGSANVGLYFLDVGTTS